MKKLVSLLFLIAAMSSAAQNHDFRFSVGGTATLGNSPPGTCGCFWLAGGSGEAALGVLPRLELAVEVTGSHASSVPQTGRGLSFITLMTGPRFQQPMPAHLALTEHLFAGAVRGFDAQFAATDTATAFGFSAGVGIECRLSPMITLRPVEVSYLHMSLPNESDNHQKELRIGGSIVFRVPARYLKR